MVMSSPIDPFRTVPRSENTIRCRSLGPDIEVAEIRTPLASLTEFAQGSPTEIRPPTAARTSRSHFACNGHQVTARAKQTRFALSAAHQFKNHLPRPRLSPFGCAILQLQTDDVDLRKEHAHERFDALGSILHARRGVVLDIGRHQSVGHVQVLSVEDFLLEAPNDRDVLCLAQVSASPLESRRIPHYAGGLHSAALNSATLSAIGAFPLTTFAPNGVAV